MSTRTNWTIIEDAAALAAAHECVRGSYQSDVLNGYHNLSGSTLRGEASRWGGKYAESRAGLLGRMNAAGVIWCERKGPHNARLLVIGASL